MAMASFEFKKKMNTPKNHGLQFFTFLFTDERKDFEKIKINFEKTEEKPNVFSSKFVDFSVSKTKIRLKITSQHNI